MSLSTIVFIGIAIVVFIQSLTMAYFMRPWTKALLSGLRIPLARLMGMKLRNVSPEIIVDAYIKAHHASIPLTLEQLESHYIAGGNPNRVVDALIKTHARNIPVSYEVVAKTDLAGFDLEDIDPEYFRKTTINTANHGLESTSAPPAAGTLETHP